MNIAVNCIAVCGGCNAIGVQSKAAQPSEPGDGSFGCRLFATSLHCDEARHCTPPDTKSDA